jgi:hypothetical protein
MPARPQSPVVPRGLSPWPHEGRKAGAGTEQQSQLPPPCCLVIWQFRNERSQPDESGRADEKGPVRALLRTYTPFSTHVLQNDR